MTTNTIDLHQSLLRKVRESADTSKQFFEDRADEISLVAQKMAQRFQQDGRLLAMGNGGSSCDAEHITVEFMHPIFEKRKSLPALCLSSNPALITSISNDLDFSKVFVEQLRRVGKPEDIALLISTSGMSPNLVAAAAEAKKLGMLTIAFNGKDGGRLAAAVDHNLGVPSYSIHRIQETHVLLLHTLWDLVHLCLGEEDIV
jgi:D-sedoheptulose 7-phosphate isomerase